MLIAKTICAFFYLHFFFLYFLYKLFFLLMKFLNTSMKKDPFNQIIRNWQPKGVFVDLLGKCLAMKAGL